MESRLTFSLISLLLLRPCQPRIILWELPWVACQLLRLPLHPSLGPQSRLCGGVRGVIDPEASRLGSLLLQFIFGLATLLLNDKVMADSITFRGEWPDSNWLYSPRTWNDDVDPGSSRVCLSQSSLTGVWDPVVLHGGHSCIRFGCAANVSHRG